MTSPPPTITERTWAVRTVLWLLGAWTALSIGMFYAAVINFRVLKPDTLPRAEEAYPGFADDAAREPAMRFTASELNRRFFTDYGTAQIPLAGLTLLLLGISRRRSKVRLGIATALLLLILTCAFLLTPELIERGRAIDFLPRDAETPERSAFSQTHGIYSGLDTLKIVLLLGLTASLLVPASPPQP